MNTFEHTITQGGINYKYSITAVAPKLTRILVIFNYKVKFADLSSHPENIINS